MTNYEEQADKLDFLKSYLLEAKREGDDFSRAWVAIQVGLSENSTYSEIEDRIERLKKTNRTASKFNV